MKFFFPDSHDFVDPTFNFESETRCEHRDIQRGYKYAHEIFKQPVYDGISVSMSMVNGHSSVKGIYTLAQRQRLYGEGIYRFMRLPEQYDTIGQSGAFAYASEEEPVYTIDELNEFYSKSGVTYGTSLDHLIFDYETSKRKVIGTNLVECIRRQEINLTLAEKFLVKNKGLSFKPYGMAHGWSPQSYSDSVQALQKMGYRRITIGGLIPLKSEEVLSVLARINDIRMVSTQLHLNGVYQLKHIAEFANFGVTSFDSSSPLMKGLKGDKNNYHTFGKSYTAIEIPQVDANNHMRKLIASGTIDLNKAIELENKCLQALISFDKGQKNKDETLDVLTEYGKLYNVKASKEYLIDEALTDKPWKKCPCDICKEVGIHVILKRGAARNRRRGFHNMYIAYQELQSELRALMIS
jgi:hypothetical protein